MLICFYANNHRKELFTRSLVNELSEPSKNQGKFTWEQLRGQGTASSLSPEDSPFEGYSGPDWNHAVKVNEPDNQ